MGRILTVMSLLFACVIAVGAEQPVPDSHLRARLGALRSGGDPYRQLFSAAKFPKPGPAVATSPSQPTPPAVSKPRVVCGMTILPADPKADPKMVLEPKKDGVDYTIRAIDPPICNPAR
jgi:hypothetical protein